MMRFLFLLKYTVTDKGLLDIGYFLAYRIFIFSEEVMAKRKKKYITEQEIRELVNQSENELSKTVLSEFADS